MFCLLLLLAVFNIKTCEAAPFGFLFIYQDKISYAQEKVRRVNDNINKSWDRVAYNRKKLDSMIYSMPFFIVTKNVGVAFHFKPNRQDFSAKVTFIYVFR